MGLYSKLLSYYGQIGGFMVKQLIFRAYNSNEIGFILKAKINSLYKDLDKLKEFHQGEEELKKCECYEYIFDDDAIRICAERVAQINGDLRAAFDICKSVLQKNKRKMIAYSEIKQEKMKENKSISELSTRKASESESWVKGEEEENSLKASSEKVVCDEEENKKEEIKEEREDEKEEEKDRILLANEEELGDEEKTEQEIEEAEIRVNPPKWRIGLELILQVLNSKYKSLVQSLINKFPIEQQIITFILYTMSRSKNKDHFKCDDVILYSFHFFSFLQTQ